MVNSDPSNVVCLPFQLASQSGLIAVRELVNEHVLSMHTLHTFRRVSCPKPPLLQVTALLKLLTHYHDVTEVR